MGATRVATGLLAACSSCGRGVRCQELETKEEKLVHLVHPLPFCCPCPSVSVCVIVIVFSATFVQQQCCHSGGG